MVDEGTILELALPMFFTTCHDVVSVQGGMWVLGLCGSLQCLNIPTNIWIYSLVCGRICTTMRFLEWCSYLFQYTKMVAICVTCWEIDSRAMEWEFHYRNWLRAMVIMVWGQDALKLKKIVRSAPSRSSSSRPICTPCPAQPGAVDVDPL